jgi:hypothetical protein
MGCVYGDTSFATRGHWISHLASDHGMEPDWTSIKCRLCTQDTGSGKATVTLHLAKHLEEISLSALPTGVDSDVPSDDEVSEPTSGKRLSASTLLSLSSNRSPTLAADPHVSITASPPRFRSPEMDSHAGSHLLAAHRPSSRGWNWADDQMLLKLRATGKNWLQIQREAFPNKTPNGCRKRHERLMEQQNQGSVDPMPTPVPTSEPQTYSWSEAQDQVLLQLRSIGKAWEQIRREAFPTKTANACRKRHERLKEWRGQGNFGPMPPLAPAIDLSSLRGSHTPPIKSQVDPLSQWHTDFGNQQDLARYPSSPKQPYFQGHRRTPAEYSDVSAMSDSVFFPKGPGTDAVQDIDHKPKTAVDMTSIRPPVAYLDFLKSMSLVSPVLNSPPRTGEQGSQQESQAAHDGALGAERDNPPEVTTTKKCAHHGCNKLYTDPDEVCRYHPGPLILDGSWKGTEHTAAQTCCKSKAN